MHMRVRRAVAVLAVAVTASLAMIVVLPTAAEAHPLPLLRSAAERPEEEDTAARYRVPVAKRWASAARLRRPHHDHPGWDVDLPIGTRVFAAHGGRVRALLTDGGCGLGIVIDGNDGFTYTYCHGVDVHVRTGEKIDAGEVIMRSGQTGSAENPHLHFEIEDAAGRLLCPQPLLVAWANGREKSPRIAPTRGCIN